MGSAEIGSGKRARNRCNTAPPPPSPYMAPPVDFFLSAPISPDHARPAKDDRAVASAALYADLPTHPGYIAAQGPNVYPGPRRYIGVLRPHDMHLLMAAWCQEMGLACPSFTTFLRALQASRGSLKFRKVAGEHPNCDECLRHKKRLKGQLSIFERKQAVEDYVAHLLTIWLDRQVDFNWVELSHQCRRGLASGVLLAALARSQSAVYIRADGMDQAKFKTPRQRGPKSHAFAKLVRPALHIQGVWCHGFGFHFACADADMHKDTNNNIESVARMLSSIHRRFGGLPSTVTLQQDNTSRECKNQNILKWAIKVRILGVVRHFNLGYPLKGHSHGPLDAVFGQAAVKMANADFDDDEELIAVLQKFLSEASLDPGSEGDATAYKLDEAADWVSWWGEVPLQMSNLTGPLAPHWFHICAREDLTSEELDAPRTAFLGAPDPTGQDIVVAIKDRMSSPKTHQVALLVSGRDVPRLRATLRERPAGLHERRAFSPKDRETVWNAAQEALRAEAISPKAAAYLQEWAIGTRRRKPRPETYEFLTPVTAAPAAAPRQGPPMWRAGREVLIRPAAGAPALPLEGDCHAEDDGLAIVLEEG